MGSEYAFTASFVINQTTTEQNSTAPTKASHTCHLKGSITTRHLFSFSPGSLRSMAVFSKKYGSEKPMAVALWSDIAKGATTKST